MAGRGRGRGRGTMSFNVESLGFGRGEALPTSSLEPPPLYPPLEFKPVPLVSGEEYDYLLALKQEFRRAMKESPYYLKPLDVKKDIERYSDKYQLGNNNNGDLQIDYKRFPSELRMKPKKRPKVGSVKPNVKKLKMKVNPEEISKTLEELEKKEAIEDQADDGVEDEAGAQAGGGEAGEEEEEGGEAAEDLEEMDEDDFEDETDYNQTYFDNGDHYGADEDDDLEDGAVF